MNKDSLARIKATPWSFYVPRGTEFVFKKKIDVEHQDLKDKVTVARQVYIKASTLVASALREDAPNLITKSPTAQAAQASRTLRHARRT